jgi:hypothetical protein
MDVILNGLQAVKDLARIGRNMILQLWLSLLVGSVN